MRSGLPSSGTGTPQRPWRRTSPTFLAGHPKRHPRHPTDEILDGRRPEGDERPDLLVGGPPCTPFSKSGFWLEWKREGLDPAPLLQAYTRVLREARPRGSSWRTSTRSPTTTRPASPPSSGFCARSTRRATTPKRSCSTPPTTGSRSHGLGCSSSGVPKGQQVRFPDAEPHAGFGSGAPAAQARPRTSRRGSARRTGDRARAWRGRSAGSTATSCRASRQVTTTCTTPQSGATPSPCSGGASRYWSFLLKLDTQGARLRRSRPSPARMSARSTGTAGACACEVKRLFTFPDEFELVGSRHPSKPSSVIPYRPGSPSRSSDLSPGKRKNNCRQQ